MTVDEIKKTIVDELHRQPRVRFKRRAYVQKGIGETLQIDLVSLIPFSEENRGYKYLLTCIDTFSKFAMVRPLKTKTGLEVAKALEDILQKYKYATSVRMICCDDGGEFKNSHVRALMQRYGIRMYSVYSKIHAGILNFSLLISSYICVWVCVSTMF